MAPPVLTTRELNRAMLARQCMLERARAPLPRVLERIAGVQAQYAPSMYIGLWSRVEGFGRHQLTRALDDRSVVQATLMRVTIHLVSAPDYWPFAIGVRESRRQWWLRTHGRGVDVADVVAAASRLRRRLADGPVRRDELEQIAGKHVVSGVGLWLDLVRVPPSGTWERRRADLYGLASAWVPPMDVSVAEGIDLLVRRYLGGFGPAAPADIGSWAGLTPPEVDSSLRRLKPRRFRSEDGEGLVDLPRAPRPPADMPAPVRFLPMWDASLLGHARRAAVLPDEHRRRIFNPRSPKTYPTFLVDGAVAGTWKYEGGGIRLEPFGKLRSCVRRELEEESERLASLHR